MYTFTRFRFAALALAALALLVTAPAQAAPLEREHYSGSFTDDFSCDGLVDLHVEGTFSGVFMLKEGRRGDPTPYYFDNFEGHQVYTNLATGKWFTVDANGLYKDLRITNVSGTVYTFEAFYAGQPFVLRDQDGNVVMRDRGHLLVTFVVDTQGDSDLSNDVFIDGSFAVLADNGAHPGFYIDFCQVAADLVG